MAYPTAHDVASQAINLIRCPRAEGPSIYWITLELLKLQLRSSIYRGYFSEMRSKSHWIQQRIYRLTVCNRRAFALSRRCWVSRSRPRVFRETITVISLWRHNSGPCDNKPRCPLSPERPLNLITHSPHLMVSGYQHAQCRQKS